MKIGNALLGFSSALVFCLNAAANTTEFTPVQQRAQGQSLAGANLLNDSLYSNPASSSFTQAYSVDASFQSVKSFAASILDTKTSAIGGIAGYYRMPFNMGDQKVEGVKVGALGRMSENFGVGILGKMIWGTDLAGAPARYTDVDLGAILHFDSIQFGLSTRNLLGGSAAMGDRREYSIGTQANWEQTVFLNAAMTGDGQNLRPLQYGFGAEYVSPYHFALKGGYRIRTASNESFWSAGASILSPKVSVHYSVEFPNQTGGSMEHMVGTTVLF